MSPCIFSCSNSGRLQGYDVPIKIDLAKEKFGWTPKYS
jgi:hypothetical protein|tara:strand:- start:310 stop:423 length:114 start_codon:yes stop_codon:yes gene_type:complete